MKYEKYIHQTKSTKLVSLKKIQFRQLAIIDNEPSPMTFETQFEQNMINTYFKDKSR